MIKPLSSLKIAARPRKLKNPIVLSPEELKKQEEESLRREELDSLKEEAKKNIEAQIKKCFEDYPFNLPQENKKVSWRVGNGTSFSFWEGDDFGEHFYAHYTYPDEITLNVTAELEATTFSPEIPVKEVEDIISDNIEFVFEEYKSFTDHLKFPNKKKHPLHERMEDILYDKIDKELYASDEDGEEIENIEHPDYWFTSVEFISPGVEIKQLTIEKGKIKLNLSITWKIRTGNLIPLALERFY